MYVKLAYETSSSVLKYVGIQYLLLLFVLYSKSTLLFAQVFLFDNVITAPVRNLTKTLKKVLNCKSAMIPTHASRFTRHSTMDP